MGIVVSTFMEVIVMYRPTSTERMALLNIELEDPICKLPISSYSHDVMRTRGIETVEDFVALDWFGMNAIARDSPYDGARIESFYHHLHGGETFADQHG